MEEYITNWWPILVDGYFHKSPGWTALVILFPLLFAWNDRFYGATGRKLYAKLLILLTAVVAWLATGHYTAFAVMLWWVYRALAFSGGAGAPETEAQRKNARLRHLALVPAMAIVAFFHGGGLTIPGVVGAVAATAVFHVYAEYATKLAVQYGNLVVAAKQAGKELAEDFNKDLERDRGIAAGIAFMLWLLLADAVGRI